MVRIVIVLISKDFFVVIRCETVSKSDLQVEGYYSCGSSSSGDYSHLQGSSYIKLYFMWPVLS